MVCASRKWRGMLANVRHQQTGAVDGKSDQEKSKSKRVSGGRSNGGKTKT